MNPTLKNFLVKGQRPDFSQFGVSDVKSAGEKFVTSEAYKNFIANGKSQSDNVSIAPFSTKALLTSTGAGGRLLGESDYLTNIIGPAQQNLTLRDLLAVQPTTNSSIEYIRETGFTNAAGMAPEGTLKPESAITFEEVTSLVRVIAHFLPVTKQIIEDVPSMQAHIDQRLIYGLKVAEENQLLNGTGTGENLQGIMTQTGVQVYTAPAGESKVESVRKAITKTYISGYPPTGVVLHPNDFEDIELLKGTDGHYIVASVSAGAEMRLWRVPIVLSTSMTEGSFLAGAFGIGAQIFDREQANVRISEHHSDFFVRNQLAVLAEERIALCIYRPESFVKGTFAV